MGSYLIGGVTWGKLLGAPPFGTHKLLSLLDASYTALTVQRAVATLSESIH